MNKKRYEAPMVRRVRLVVKDAILGNCHSSPNLTPKSATSCSTTPTGCWNPPS